MAIEMTQKRTLRAPLNELTAGLFTDFLAGVSRGTPVKIASYFAGDQRDKGAIVMEVDIDAKDA